MQFTHGLHADARRIARQIGQRRFFDFGNILGCADHLQICIILDAAFSSWGLTIAAVAASLINLDAVRYF